MIFMYHGACDRHVQWSTGNRKSFNICSLHPRPRSKCFTYSPLVLMRRFAFDPVLFPAGTGCYIGSAFSKHPFVTHPSIGFHPNRLAIHALRTYLPTVSNSNLRVVSTGIVSDTPTCSLRERVTAIDSLLQPSSDSRGCGAITVSAPCWPVSPIYK